MSNYWEPLNPANGEWPITLEGALFDAAGSTSTQGIWSRGATGQDGPFVIERTVAAAVVAVSGGAGAANDVAAGTGARTIIIVGVDASYNLAFETITMTGATPTGGTTTEFLHINNAFVATAGSLLFNSGDITLSIGGTTVAYIESGDSWFRGCIFAVPVGYELKMGLQGGMCQTGTGQTKHQIYSSTAGRITRKGNNAYLLNTSRENMPIGLTVKATEVVAITMSFTAATAFQGIFLSETATLRKIS